MARVVVVVPVDLAVGWVVEAAVGLVVGTDDGPEEDAAAVWLAARDAQPVMARAATTAMAMIRTGRMVIPPTATTLRAQDRSLARVGHSTAADRRRGDREPASTRSRSSSQWTRLRLVPSGGRQQRRSPLHSQDQVNINLLAFSMPERDVIEARPPGAQPMEVTGAATPAGL